MVSVLSNVCLKGLDSGLKMSRSFIREGTASEWMNESQRLDQVDTPNTKFDKEKRYSSLTSAHDDCGHVMVYGM